MRNVAADIAAVLEASSTLALTLGTDLFAGPFPVQAKGKLVGVMPLTGTGEPYADSRGDLWTVDVEVTVRGESHDYKATLDRALSVFGVLHRAQAAPYVSILCEDAVPEWDGFDEQNRPVFTITLTAVYETTRAGEALVVLPSEGLLRVDGVEFPDGSTLTSAPAPVDLSAYATKSGTETLANKTLATPVVTGSLLPATAGQQALGSAALPWGQVHLAGSAAGALNGPLQIDAANATNTPTINVTRLGAGNSGLRMDTSQSGVGAGIITLGIQNTSQYGANSRPFSFLASRRSMAFIADSGGAAYDDNTHAFLFHDHTGGRTTVRVQAPVGRTDDLQEWGHLENASARVKSVHARVGANGEIETVAGVILRSPNGTRYRITVADDGTLSTEAA